ncbi:DUF1080 domain-containing protein [Planotetraspora sp. A-T 1434]|uniref:CBM35 domain-containing protein n=1 Tax=Planotetraspora sp. A-T 1434 TaxID=2979219 RepID=UPI0021BFC13A|nr:CBM35 domain-containing protein [Planotetraspora sp. A-T 1434]MCT9935094.1 DUF1080 domain-containing protein [Planotetraspora sp. A-T 1434]
MHQSTRAGLVFFALLALILSALPNLAAQAATNRYEAENATISQGVLETTHTGFSGTGYVNGDNVTGSYVEFAVNAPVAGSATVSIRYSNGTTTNRPANIAVNGTVVSANRAFNSTGTWDTWATATLTATLNAGANTVRITSTTSNGNPNLDYLEVVTSDTPSSEYQAESATLSQAAVASNHTGFTGTGFVDYVNTTGGYIEWTVSAASAGTASLVLRYANGTTTNRPLDISVNGTVVAAGKAFNATANWDTWADATISAPLNAGTNTVRATATTANGGPNIDKLTVIGGGTDDTQAPSVPTGPQVTATTAASISLSWTASTDNVAVTGYRVYEGSTVVATPSGTTATVSGLAASSTHTYTITAVDAAGNESGHSSEVTGTTSDGNPSNPYGDPNLVSMFNGTTLDGWTPHAANGWTVQNNAIHGTGASRGWIYYNKKQVGSFRWIFNVRQVVGDHAPTVLIWGTTDPIRDALSAIQFQPPNGGHWDYRPGHNDGGGSLFTQLPHTKIDIHVWSQCEIVANQTTGVARMACCPLPSGATTCKGVEVLRFKDPTAGRVGPLAIQVHNSGIQDEYRSLYVESPVVTSPDEFITT